MFKWLQSCESIWSYLINHMNDFIILPHPISGRLLIMQWQDFILTSLTTFIQMWRFSRRHNVFKLGLQIHLHQYETCFMLLDMCARTKLDSCVTSMLRRLACWSPLMLSGPFSASLLLTNFGRAIPSGHQPVSSEPGSQPRPPWDLSIDRSENRD